MVGTRPLSSIRKILTRVPLCRDLPRLAKNPPPVESGSAPPNPCYTLLRSFQFHRNIWVGYEHRMTKGERAHGKGKTGEGGEDRTWEFYLKDEDEG